LKQFEQCPLRYYRQRVVQDIKDVGTKASWAGDRSHEALEKRINDKVPLPHDLAHHEPVVGAFEAAAQGGTIKAEVDRCLNRSFAPGGWWDRDVFLRTKTDVEVVAGNRAVIADWKTGKRYPDFFQMEIAAAATMIHSPAVQSVTAVFVWLKDRKQDSEVYSRTQIPDLLAGVVQRVNKIKEAHAQNRWPARPSGLCNFCPAKPTCPHAK
jgi:hypothetical protein